MQYSMEMLLEFGKLMFINVVFLTCYNMLFTAAQFSLYDIDIRCARLGTIVAHQPVECYISLVKHIFIKRNEFGAVQNAR